MSQNDEMATTNPQPSAQTARKMEHNSAIGEAHAARRWSENILVLLFFGFLTALLSWPMVVRLGSGVVGGPGDNYHYLWELWYVAHAAFDLHTSPFFDADIYVPFGFDLIKNQDLSPGTVLLFMPLTRLVGEVACYNTLILGSFALTAFGVFLLARELWSSRAGALLAGIGVGFCAYRVIHAGGHLSIVSTQWIPFFFLYLEKTMRRPSLRNGAITGLFYALCALATWYYASAVPIAAVLYLLFRKRWWRDRQQVLLLIKPGLVAIAVAVVVVLPFAIPYAIATRTVMEPRPLTESQAFSASVTDFFIPSIHHPLWGDWIQQHWRSGANGAWLSEWEVYLGVVLLSLAVVGAFGCKKRRIVFALLVLAAGAFILALGPSLYLLHPPSPPGFENHAPLSPILLPVRFLNSFPPFSFLRAWARMGFFVELSVGLLAAAGLSYLRTTLGATRPALRLLVTSVAIGAVLMDAMVKPVRIEQVGPRAVDRWLAAQREKFIVMEFPIPLHAYSGPAMYSTRLHGKRIVMGYGSYPPNLKYIGLMSVFPAADSLDLLQEWGTKFILVDENLYLSGSEFMQLRQTWNSLRTAMAASNRLKEVTVLDGVHVYELLPVPPELAGSSTLEAIPNPVPAQPPPSQTCSAIVWNTHGESTGQVYLSVNGGPSLLFAEGGKGVKIFFGIRPDVAYKFWLQDGKNNPTLTVQSEVAPPLVATPVIFVPTSNLGRTVVSWNTGDEGDGEIYVSQDDGPESRFAQGPIGSAPAPWIAAGQSYEFRLYVTKGSRRLLAKALVKAEKPAR